MSRFQKLALLTTGMTVVLVMVGALVRATGSGLGCPDWPRCHGSWLPPMQKKAIIEYSHRLAASIVGMLVLAMAIMAWLKHRSVGVVFWPSFLALVTVIVQAGIGRQVVLGDLQADLVITHFLTSLTLLGLLTLATANSLQPRGGGFDALSRQAAFATGATFAVLLFGAFVVQRGAGGAFTDWPLMNGSLLPPEGERALVHYLHRIVAGLLGVTLIRLAIRVNGREPKDRILLMLSRSAVALWLVQVLIGATYVLSGSPSWTVVAHVVTAAMLWVVMVFLGVLSYRRAAVTAGVGDPGPVRGPKASPVEKRPAGFTRIRAYFMLTKPRIIELLLITTVPAMIAAAGAWPPWSLVLATLVGGSMAAGSANAINCYLDRDIDELMPRTSIRPLPKHQVEPANALVFGIVLGVVSFAFLALAVNMLAALLSMSAILFYIVVYTIGLKRYTPSNIVIGGAAGAAPALIGWAAVTGTVGRPAWVLFAIIFYWTPPHFWALALRYCDEYRAAGVPMLPVVRGVEETTRQILLYAVALWAVSLLLYPVGRLGLIYLVSAVALGAAFVFYALRLKAQPEAKGAMGLFHFSISYLVLLFVGLAADRLIGAPAIESLYEPILLAAAITFLVCSAAILFGVIGYRRPTGSPGRLRVLAVEVVWTMIPLVMMGLLFLASWNTEALASP
ncbi:MAG: heme o synthase [Actinomycetota bacterium]